VCGTPRTGSTYLCDLLASTGVAGRPESYFREPDQQAWAGRFGVRVSGDGSFEYSAFVKGAVQAGTSRNGVFAARVMWGTLDVVVRGLRTSPTASDLEVLTAAFGPTHFVYLRRIDVIGQAVSWARAEQTGYWQRGDADEVEPHLDIGQVDDLLRTVRDHNDAWCAWFAEQRVEPKEVIYEDLIEDPDGTVFQVLESLGLVAPSGWRSGSTHVRQADQINKEWIRRYSEGRW
jgi:LPS sulfotransferase NodH